MSVEESSFAQVMGNLKKEVAKIENGSFSGLLRGIILIRRSMDKNPPLIPVDTNNLRSSWFVTTSDGKRITESTADPGVVASAEAEAKSSLGLGTYLAIMGFSANYAVFVHENVGARFQRPNAGAKFFEAAINRNKTEVLRLVAEGGRKGR